MSEKVDYKAWPNLTGGNAHSECRASIILPARNEAASLAMTLDGLSQQVDIEGEPLPPHFFEVLLLLNNCTDGSKAIAIEWAASHPRTVVHVLECTLAGERAHVGTARRMLMDTAWWRLNDGRRGVSAILSTDSDSLVACDWVARNLAALQSGADAVGGVIQLRAGELESLPDGARRAYLLDREYQRLVAQIEDLLDPQEGDRWPRHLEHFGASLTCTPDAYARSGGMPPVKPLEDVAFVEALRRSGCVIRHDPAVVVFTSSRLDGRAEIGLSYQLREWQRMSECQEPHLVDSGEWLTHRFNVLAILRELYRAGSASDAPMFSMEINEGIGRAIEHAHNESEFLIEVDCEKIVHETFRGARRGKIEDVNRHLASSIKLLRITDSMAVSSGH